VNAAIFFDRDDTLIKDSGYMNAPDNIIYIDHVFETLNLLKEKFDFFVVTNQSGIPRDLVEPKNLKLIHQKMQLDFADKDLFIKEFISAPFMPESGHYYRKPNPGMILELVNHYGYDPNKCWMVGDRESDVIAGKKAGVQSILFTNKENVTSESSQYTVNNFKAISSIILESGS
jgi:histidinol-phosphate phosphatase family protein